MPSAGFGFLDAAAVCVRSSDPLWPDAPRSASSILVSKSISPESSTMTGTLRSRRTRILRRRSVAGFLLVGGPGGWGAAGVVGVGDVGVVLRWSFPLNCQAEEFFGVPTTTATRSRGLLEGSAVWPVDDTDGEGAPLTPARMRCATSERRSERLRL